MASGILSPVRAETLPGTASTGRWLVFIAGLIPATAGLAILGLTAWSATGGIHGPWMSLMGSHGFSGAEIAGDGRELWALWILNSHLAGVNLAMSGATIAVLAWFGLRDRLRWVAVLLVVMLIWVGGNDVAALIAFRMATGMGVPVALAPLSIGLAGMAMYWRGLRHL